MHFVDWTIVAVYLVFVLVVGFALQRSASVDRVSYFLADRALPWWWAGLSIAATTFAADTPLAVTGIVARRGISGNWFWLSNIALHAALVVYFARAWRRTETMTDAELVSLRYSGRAAPWLRSFRAGLAGLVMNAIVLGWVLRAMVKIARPFFRWEDWTPGLVDALDRAWPSGGALGEPGDGLTIGLLLLLVGTYSTMSGLRGVVFTDLFQLAAALIGSFVLGGFAWRLVGGREGLLGALAEQYGSSERFVYLFPSPDADWIAALGMAPGLFALYLVVQAFSYSAGDGGGYVMQRINSTRDQGQAGGAALLFLVLQYLVRAWPWYVVGLVALVVMPLEGSPAARFAEVVPPEAVAAVTADREMAYPVLMQALLPPVFLGLTVTSLLAAFMSTVDTHINWGASYVVNDFYVRLRPDSTPRQQVRASRWAVAGFTALALLISFRIDQIEQAWQWLSAIGAALAVPTVARWLWWRVTAESELAAAGAGLAAAVALQLSGVGYEQALLGIAAASAAGMLAAIALGPSTDPRVVAAFVERVDPIGFWPGRPIGSALPALARDGARWVALGGGTVAVLAALHRLLFEPLDVVGPALLGGGVVLIAAATFTGGERRAR